MRFTRAGTMAFLISKRGLLIDARSISKPKAPLTINLVTLATSVVLSFLFIEGFLRVFSNAALSASERRELEWRNNHKNAEQILTRKWHSYDTYSSEPGWIPRPNLRTSKFNSNSIGLRGTREYLLEPPHGVRRILAIGDSFMFGEDLSDEQTVPRQLEALLNRSGRWEVLNLAEHGYGTDQQWLRLQHLGFHFRADVVVIGFYEDDLSRNTLSFRDYAKPYFKLAGKRLILRNTPVPSPEDLLSRPPKWPTCALRSWCALETVYQHGARVLPWLPGFEHTRAAKVTLAILDAMLHESRNHGMRFVLMIIPPHQLRSDPSKVEILLSKWAVKTRTPLIRLREAYLRLPRSAQARLYAGHWTAYGAAVTAEVLVKTIHDILPDESRARSS